MAHWRLRFRRREAFLSTQIWNYSVETAVVAQEFHADGGTKQYKYDSAGNERVVIDELGRRTDYTYDAANNLIRIDRPMLANGTRATEFFEYDVAGNRIAHTDAMGVVSLLVAIDTRCEPRCTRRHGGCWIRSWQR